jgi:hypothetical protein
MSQLTAEQKASILGSLKIGKQILVEIVNATTGKPSIEEAKFEVYTKGGRFRCRRAGGVMCWCDADKFVGLAEAAAPVVSAPVVAQEEPAALIDGRAEMQPAANPAKKAAKPKPAPAVPELTPEEVAGVQELNAGLAGLAKEIVAKRAAKPKATKPATAEERAVVQTVWTEKVDALGEDLLSEGVVGSYVPDNGAVIVTEPTKFIEWGQNAQMQAVPEQNLPPFLAELGGTMQMTPDGSAFTMSVDVPMLPTPPERVGRKIVVEQPAFVPAKKGDVISLDLPQHNWDKLNLVTKHSKGRSFDVWGCRACGLAGNRYGVSGKIEVTKAAGKKECRPVAPELVGMAPIFPVEGAKPVAEVLADVPAEKPARAKKERKAAVPAEPGLALRPKGGRPAPGSKSLRQLVLEEMQAVADKDGKLEQTGPQFALLIKDKLNATPQAINNALFKLSAAGFIAPNENTRKPGPVVLTAKGKAGYSINPVGGAGTVKAKIKELLAKGGLTDRQVAMQVGADVGYVSDVRTGRVTGKPRKAVQMVEEAVTE